MQKTAIATTMPEPDWRRDHQGSRFWSPIKRGCRAVTARQSSAAMTDKLSPHPTAAATGPRGDASVSWLMIYDAQR